MSQRNKDRSHSLSSLQESADSPMMEAPDSPPADTTPSNSQPTAGTSSNSFSPTSAQHSGSNTSTKSGSSTTGKPKVDFGAPGSAWSSKKHLDEYARAMNSLVDLDTDAISKYGDVLQSVPKH